MYTYIFIYTYTRVCMSIYIYTSTYIDLYAYIYICIYIYICRPLQGQVRQRSRDIANLAVSSGPSMHSFGYVASNPSVTFGIPALRGPASNPSAVFLKEAQSLIFSLWWRNLNAFLG